MSMDKPDDSPVQKPAETDQSRKHLKREMGLPSLVMLAIGAIVGAGVFVLIGLGAGAAGPALILAFLFNGIIALIVGASYAEMIAAVPKTGAVYHWVKDGVNQGAGFFAGWISWFAQTSACALYSMAFASFTVELYQTVSGNDLEQTASLEFALATVAIAVMIVVNFRSADVTGKAEIILTGIKLALLLAVIAFGLSVLFGKPQPTAAFEPFMPRGITGVLAAMGLTFVAFEGYEIITQAGEEARDPGRNIPRAIFISLAVVIVVYILTAIVMIGASDPPEGTPAWKYVGQLGELGFIESAHSFVPYGKRILLVAGMASTASALNATLFSSTRMAFAMGRDGAFPSMFAKLHQSNGTPYVAILFGGFIMIAMAGLLPIKDVAASADIMFLLLFVLVCITVIRFRKLKPNLERPFKSPFFPVLQITGIVGGLALSLALYHLSPLAWITAGIWFFVGALLYWLYSRQRIQN